MLHPSYSDLMNVVNSKESKTDHWGQESTGEC